ncbi:hypothetical protein HD554DRAFT_2315952 [Boletus coccyginus]|nr:hypothetical protein HD554DRAFT_2315952 [Boletus coccyginus]
MPLQRHRSPVAIVTVPRSTLAQAHHKDIDAVLKDLKLCSRRLKSALDSFRDELRTLERLYYKGKNQHRMALFFKRVPEMRRYGRRLSELDILERVDLLRASFVGLEHTSDRKALRDSWTHVPEKPYVDFLTERLAACSSLVCKVRLKEHLVFYPPQTLQMRDRLEKAYHHFALAMQSGAFVQFFVLFAAISSRMSVLSSQLEEALQLSISTCNRLLVITHPTGTHAQQLPSEPETPRPSRIGPDVPSEDTRQPLSRCEPVDTSTSVVEDLNSEMKATSEVRMTPPPSHPIHTGDHTTAQASKKATVRAAQKPRPKKAKKKFDEIDEIFGF